MKLITKQIETNNATVSVIEPMNRIVVIDCSGSMSSELPKLRTMLKNKLPTMVQENDTLSIVWFSGKGQCGILFEGMKVNDVVSLSTINAAIDRFIKPIGMTAFVDPLEEVISLTKRLSGNCSLHFSSDGYDNQYTKKDILAVCASLADVVASATFVEYSYNADSKTLQEMAEEVSGSVVLAEDYLSYVDNLTNSFKNSTSNKKIKVDGISADFVVGNMEDGFVVAKPDADGVCVLPSNTLSYTYLQGSGDVETWTPTKESLYAVSALVQRGKADLALQICALVGDETLYNVVQNSFSKQDYLRVTELANSMASGKIPLYKDAPRNTNLVCDSNAYNVLTLLMDLASEEGNYLHISHPEFSYSSIGDKRESVVSEDGYVPVFIDTSDDIKAKITSLKFDEDRPNISILVQRQGKVNLPKNEFGFDDNFDTFIWRNYAIVRDGIVNTKKLPVVLCKSTHDLFTQLGVVTEPFKVNATYVIDLKKYPVINRSMVESKTSAELFGDAFTLYKLRCEQKYLNSMVEKPEVSQEFASLYGEEAALFLKTCGITSGGFSPKTIKAESVDSYTAKVLSIKMAGLSSIPSVDDVNKAISSGKALTVSNQLMANAIKKYDGCVDPKGELKCVKRDIKLVLDRIIKTKFGIIVGKSWFTDMNSIDDNVREIDFSLSKPIKCTVLLDDKLI